ncbi:UNVERIFIED_CONTAM: hypothetical protein FKN15_046670 [Acipenser sinensis]
MSMRNKKDLLGMMGNPEWISDVRAGSAASCGNHIKSSCSLIAFNTEQGGGGVLGLVSLDNGNEGKRSVSQLHCHAELYYDVFVKSHANECCLKRPIIIIYFLADALIQCDLQS